MSDNKYNTHRRQTIYLTADTFQGCTLSQVLENIQEQCSDGEGEIADGRFDVGGLPGGYGMGEIVFTYWVPLTEGEIQMREARLAKKREKSEKSREAAKKGQKTKVERQVREALDILAKHQDVLTEIMDK